jgi:hypothetical protein
VSRRLLSAVITRPSLMESGIWRRSSQERGLGGLMQLVRKNGLTVTGMSSSPDENQGLLCGVVHGVILSRRRRPLLSRLVNSIHVPVKYLRPSPWRRRNIRSWMAGVRAMTLSQSRETLCRTKTCCGGRYLKVSLAHMER